jgi:hypothetical protein
MECQASIFTLTLGTARMAELLAECVVATLFTREGFLVLILVRGGVDLRATECRRKDEVT